jgi:hypothetical protein
MDKSIPNSGTSSSGEVCRFRIARSCCDERLKFVVEDSAKTWLSVKNFRTGTTSEEKVLSGSINVVVSANTSSSTRRGAIIPDWDGSSALCPSNRFLVIVQEKKCCYAITGVHNIDAFEHTMTAKVEKYIITADNPPCSGGTITPTLVEPTCS